MTTAYALTVIEEHGARPGLTKFVENVHAVISGLAAELDVPAFHLDVVLTCDITASIRACGEAAFTPERGAGLVKGKTIARVRDYSETVIVLGTEETDEDFDLVQFLHLIVHEYGHLLIGRLRAAAGTRPPKPTRAQVPAEAAMILAYEAADEYRCNLLSNQVLNTFFTDQDSGKSRPFTIADLFEDDYRNGFRDVLDAVDPGWPDLVDAYLTDQIGLVEVYNGLVLGTDAVLKLIAHADSVEQAAGNPPLLSGFPHPAVTERLEPVWAAIREELESQDILPPLAKFAVADRAVQDCGMHIVDMWAALGLSGHLTEDNEAVITVS
ncbi:hypothetical protein ACWD4L_46035 [Streptomyces sp. NPDC002596]